MVLARFVPDLIPDGPAGTWMFSAFGPFLISVAVMGWWIICSRARWFERLLGLVGIIAVISLVIAVSDRSMGGPLVIVMTIPMAIAGFAIGLILLGSRLSISRTTIALVLALIGAGVSALTKTDGVWGNFAFGLDWRWNKTAEEEFLASRKNGPADPSAAKIEASKDVFLQPEWPGFRGPLQDGVQHGKSFSSDWKANPPKELWRIPLGPAWSSFAVAGKYLVTQEQRGEFEAVVCYESESGKQVWANETPSRFFEALGGARTASHSYHRRGIYLFYGSGRLVAQIERYQRRTALEGRHSKSGGMRSTDVGLFVISARFRRDCNSSCRWERG
jgi:hypothetical protein